MQLAYIARRFAVFLLIVWLAASLNFFLPRLSGQDPVRAKLLQQASFGGYVAASHHGADGETGIRRIGARHRGARQLQHVR